MTIRDHASLYIGKGLENTISDDSGLFLDGPKGTLATKQVLDSDEKVGKFVIDEVDQGKGVSTKSTHPEIISGDSKLTVQQSGAIFSGSNFTGPQMPVCNSLISNGSGGWDRTTSLSYDHQGVAQPLSAIVSGDCVSLDHLPPPDRQLLARVIDAWADLPAPLRLAVLAIINAVPGKGGNP